MKAGARGSAPARTLDVAGKLEPAQRVQPAVRKFNGF